MMPRDDRPARRSVTAFTYTVDSLEFNIRRSQITPLLCVKMTLREWLTSLYLRTGFLSLSFRQRFLLCCLFGLRKSSQFDKVEATFGENCVHCQTEKVMCCEPRSSPSGAAGSPVFWDILSSNKHFEIS